MHETKCGLCYSTDNYEIMQIKHRDDTVETDVVDVMENLKTNVARNVSASIARVTGAIENDDENA